MLNSILHYFILVFIVGLGSFVYFSFLKMGMNKVIMKKVDINYVYTSFMIRFVLAGVFFFFILKYYKKIDELILVVATFVFVRWVIIKKDREQIKNSKNKGRDIL